MKTKSNLLLRCVMLPLLLTGPMAWAQKPDPFDQAAANGTAPAAASPSDEAMPAQALVRLEWVSLTPAAARTALRKYPAQLDLHQWVQDELDKEKNGAVTLERLEVLRVRSGQKSKMEAINEYPYPTEFDNGSVPQSVGLGVPAGALDTSTTTVTTPPAPPAPSQQPSPQGAQGEAGPAGLAPGAMTGLPADFLKTPIIPQSFEFKNTGWTAEMELTLSEDGQIADVNYAPEHIKCVSQISWSLGEIKQPIFETQKISLSVAVRVGQPALVGTMSPPTNSGAPGGNTEPRVWFHFMTVNLPQ